MEVFDAAELWSRDQIEHTQLTRLKATVAHVRKSEFYRRRLDEAGVTPESITSLDDIRRIPFTTKQDLRDQYPTGLLCVPRSEIVRMHCSSGTTGSPVAICHTQNDINCWADLMARCLYMVGVRRDDVFQNMSGYGLFTGGLGIHFGAERLGCMTIPAGPGNSRRQIKLAKDFKTTVAHILPSYALILGEHLRNMGEDPRDFPLRIAVVGAEPYTVEFRRRIEELFDMKAYNSYGLSEMNGPGVAFECQNQNGLHVWEDAYLPEIVDPKTGEPGPDGEIGEICVKGDTVMMGYYKMPEATANAIDADGYLHSGDLGVRDENGNFRITGRIKDMIIRGGENIYPRELEEFLYHFPGVKDVQVAAVPSKKYGEEVGAFIILHDGVTATEEEVKDFCRGKIARHKIPKYIFFVDTFPMTGSGKIQKFKLKDLGLKLLQEQGITPA